LNHSLHRSLFLLATLLLVPYGLLAAPVQLKTDEARIADLVSDIPCLTLSDNAATEVFLEDTPDI
jgi:hypothetical protein